MRKLVLWGHQADEYQEMFDLDEKDMGSRILEYGCGPSAVNAHSNHKEQLITSCDPLFVLDKDTLYSKALMIFSDMAEEIKKEEHYFDFSRSGGIDNLIKQRQQGMQEFFADYNEGKSSGRYIGVTDIKLPFPDFHFDFALCSHYLFAELDDQSVDYHLQVIRELARVAREVRVFPLVDREGNTSTLLGPVLLGLQQYKLGVEVREVSFHLHKSGNAMLRVWAQKCDL